MQINYLVVVVAAILNMVVGAIWYSSALFAKPWMQITGRKMDAGGSPAKGYAVSVVASLVMAWVLAYFINQLNVGGFANGMVVGFWAWLGFVVTSQAANFAFEGRDWKLYLINVGYVLVALVLMGGLLAAWH